VRSPETSKKKNWAKLFQTGGGRGKGAICRTKRRQPEPGGEMVTSRGGGKSRYEITTFG